jgi:hypothetical protein
MSALIANPPGLGAMRSTLRPAAYVYAGLWLLTALAAAAALAWPALGPGTAPHPTLTPTIGAIAGILLDNTRALAPPLLLALLGFGAHRGSRALGDLLVALPLATTSIDVGLALGGWGGRLLPYIPQLPLEYAAAAAAANLWLTHRRKSGTTGAAIAPAATQTLALLVAAAAIEVLATPHAR